MEHMMDFYKKRSFSQNIDWETEQGNLNKRE
jgi:hypothetical protein